MAKKQIPDEVRAFLAKVGGKGGKARAKALTADELSAIGKMGGRPKGSAKKKRTKEKN